MKLACLFCLLLPLSTFAQESETGSEYDAQYQKCVDETGPINNTVVHACASEVSEKAKKEINARYRSIYARLAADDPGEADKFEGSQQAWLRYRNSHCALAGAHIGSPMYDFCPMTLNIARALELRELDGE